MNAVLASTTRVDAELPLFVELLRDPPALLAATPHLHAVSWWGGRFDLLFTDGHGRWCAVEVKRGLAVEGSGRTRKNRRTHRRARLAKLRAQTRLAWQTCREQLGGIVRAVGLWYDGGAWVVVAEEGDRAAAG